MSQLNSEIVDELRSMARRNCRVSQMLREVSRTLGPEMPHELTLAQYLRDAFGLTLAQVKPIGGWYPDGEGELSDSQLDDLIMPEIRRNRQQWDRLAASS